MKYKINSLSRDLGQTIISMKSSWRIILLSSFFLCGLIIGAYVVKNNNSLLSNQLSDIISSAIKNKSNSDFLKTFTETFITDSVFLIISFILGLCAVGIPLISLIPFIKGFGIGITGAYVYSVYSIKGVCYCLFVFFPAQVLISAILIFACNESFYMSEDIFSTLNSGSIKEKNLVRLYLTRFGLLLLFTCFTALLDALLSTVFSSVFSLF